MKLNCHGIDPQPKVTSWSVPPPPPPFLNLEQQTTPIDRRQDLSLTETGLKRLLRGSDLRFQLLLTSGCFQLVSADASVSLLSRALTGFRAFLAADVSAFLLQLAPSRVYAAADATTIRLLMALKVSVVCFNHFFAGGQCVLFQLTQACSCCWSY